MTTVSIVTTTMVLASIASSLAWARIIDRPRRTPGSCRCRYCRRLKWEQR